MFNLTVEEVKELSKEYNMIPLTLECYADMDTPISVFKRMQTEKDCFLLESIGQNHVTARFSFIGRNPFVSFQSLGDKITITDYTGKVNTYTGKPMQELEKLVTSYRAPKLNDIPSFNGGAVGFFAYDIIRQYEYLPDINTDELGIPDMQFMLMDEIIAFDHIRQKLVIVVNIHAEGDIEAQYRKATLRLLDIREEMSDLSALMKKEKREYRSVSKMESNMTKEQFCANVEKAKEYIRNGDIFQVVLSQRFTVETNENPFNVYRALRLINPSPYMYYLDFGDYQIVGASPEMLVRVENGIVQTGPIAGTRPRGKTIEEDMALEEELLNDEKEIAEHTMLVDLGRNDVGRVSEFGSVKVTRFKYVERFSHVMHIISDVEGKLRSDKSCFDALGSTLPAGTLSGAPKIRAMEIIDELENTKRSTYGGAVSYISFNGNFDSCITIRTGVFKDGKAYIQAGGGIVYDSVPENEYQESVNKASAVLRAIEKAGDVT
ncbi:MAG: anthranilate synthase component I [Oscillospiraceae bacterium]|nr:anthranilate synthase component I [Oscillospiraceae bacterium]